MTGSSWQKVVRYLCNPFAICLLLALGSGCEKSPPAAPPAKKESLVVAPNEGIGPIRFGMSREEIEKHMGGPPDQIAASGKVLRYFSKGLNLLMHKERGLVAITGQSKMASGHLMADCPCKTKDGIGIGSSAEEVTRSLGEPTQKSGKGDQVTYIYDNLSLEITFYKDKMTQFQMRIPK